MESPEPPSSIDRALRALREDDAAVGASSASKHGCGRRARSGGGTTKTLGRSDAGSGCRTHGGGRSANLAATLGLVAGIAPDDARDSEIRTEFFPLAYGSVPTNEGQLVRLELPRTALTRFGLGSGDAFEAKSANTVLADVIVGEDGIARAVRFVRPVGQ